MNYRTIKKTNTKISEISLGAEHIERAPYDVVKRIIDMAIDHGVNYTDLFSGYPIIRDYFGKALKGKRNNMIIAGHLGADVKDNQYHRIRDMKRIKELFYDLLDRLNTDYIDTIMLHNIDHEDDLKICLENGMLEFALELKKKGLARMIGISTHVPKIARDAILTGHMDTVMFSLNPLFDLLPANSDIGKLVESKLDDDVAINTERHALCEFCEDNDVGIVVMKAFAGGRLLNGVSPIQMSVNQCLHYALAQKGVVSVAAGCRTVDEFKEILEYKNAGDIDKDFGQIYTKALSLKGNPQCVYCNHCLPCPQNINIGEAMRTIDAGGTPPDNCISCGMCEEQCPFGVNVIDVFNS